MGYKVVETQSAIKDLTGIISHIVVSLQNPQAAAQLADEMEQCYAHLARMPRMYECCRDARNKEKGYRRMVVRNYVVIYRVDDRAETVYIMRIFYGKRDYLELL